MTLSTLRLINCIAQVVVLVVFLVGILVVLAHFGSLPVSLGILGAMVFGITTVFVREIRRRRPAKARSVRTMPMFGVISRVHHSLEPLTIDATDGVLSWLLGDPQRFERAIETGW